MSELRDRIIDLRRMGYSLKNIARTVGCAKSTAGLHSRGIVVADRSEIERSIRENAKNASRCNEKKWDNLIKTTIENARKEWTTVRNDPELMGFLGLYWGEGTKIAKGHRTPPIGIANSDPDVIIKCKRCFDRLSADNKYRCNLIIYEDLNLDETKSFWENITGVKVGRVEVRKSHNLRRCKHGTCYLRFSNFELIHRLLTWIDCWKKEPMARIGLATL